MWSELIHPTPGPGPPLRPAAAPEWVIPRPPTPAAEETAVSLHRGGPHPAAAPLTHYLCLVMPAPAGRGGGPGELLHFDSVSMWPQPRL